MIKVLIVLVAIVFVAQVVRIFELSNLITKTKNEVSDRSNHINGVLLLLSGIGLLAFFFWQRAEWMDETLQVAASEHGPIIDNLWDTTMGLIIVVFLILTPMLFGIAFFYRGKEDKKASYITHNNKLEFFWTAIPAVVLMALISYGLVVWGKIVNQDISDAMVIEIYAKQFSWTARYAGDDNKLGRADVRFVGGKNELGVISQKTKENQISAIEKKIINLNLDLKSSENPAEKKLITKKIDKLEKQKKTLITYFITTPMDKLLSAEDDVVTKELHLPVGKKVLFKFRSQDVIHSAYLPHFRVQMNCVPGTTTQFAFTPTITTVDMKKELNDESFEYVMLCNKICGNAHYNMQMKVIVETEEEYNAWMETQNNTRISNL
ncbi:MAG: cytochrome C oxidase subunit II [Flavobacteriales bacterium]|nr:cytochrome C oxidase subunit II [Flavobacteriales bacterium]